jgi:GTP cyclohydrolase I
MKVPKKVVKLAAPRRARELESDPKPGAIARHFEEILKELGEDPSREGLAGTPMRSEKALRFLTTGYYENIAEIVNGALFDVQYDEMVVVKDIEFYSLCEHHVLPFFGRMHVAYIPKGRVLGLSKIARIVDMFARRLQVQERLTQQVAEALRDVLHARGVGVVAEAQHFCMMMRGVEKQHSSAATSAMLGAFRNSQKTREEFLSLIRLRDRG